MNENIEWLIGLALILIYAQSRFNTPKSNRSSTTLYRYYFAFFCYFMSLCLLYLLLGGGISASPAIYDLLTKGAEGATDKVEPLAGGPLLSALFLTTLLPNFPILTKVDAWLRGTFQDIGHIPREARELSGNMRRSTYVVPKHRRDEVRRYLADFPETDIRFRLDNSSQAEWTQVTSLWLEVKSWADKKKYSGFLESFKSDYRQIEMGYEKLCVKALKCFRWMSNCDDLGEPSFHLLKECQKDFQDQMIVLKKDLSNYIARGVLTCEITGKERRAKLEEMGFHSIADDRSPLTAHQVVTIGFIVFLFMFFGNQLFRDTPWLISRAILISTMVATIYGLSILLAIYLKVVWPFADIRRVGQRPVASYVVAGLLAVVLALFISLTFKFVWYRDFLKALDDVKMTYPWLLMSFTIAATLSCLCDNGVLGKKSPSPWMRGLESIACAVVLMVASWVVNRWLPQTGLPEGRIPPLQVVAFITCGIGLAIGYFVPHWYRSLPPETIADAEPKSLVALDAVGGS
jgi:hypothetical protein